MRIRNINPLFVTLSLSVCIHGGVLWLAAGIPRPARPDTDRAVPVTVLPAAPPPESPPVTVPPEKPQTEIPPPVTEVAAHPAEPAPSAAETPEPIAKTSEPSSPGTPAGQQGFSAPTATPFTLPNLPAPVREDAIKRYAITIHSLIDRRKEYPYRARRQDQEGAVQIRFTLTRQGSLKGDPVMETQSRYRLLNESALEAVKNAAPYPPFPEEIPEDEMSFQVTVSFSLK
jgi:protein TonB